VDIRAKRKAMKALEFDAASIESAWTAFEHTVGGLLPIRSDRQYRRTVRLLNALLDVVGADERHPLAGLLDVLADLVSAYEAREIPMPDAEPREVLRLLMDANGLTQTELGAELGGQPVVSAILNGKREINARQASALASRFGVSAAVFIA
jgi:HTH-type transcriptional regulator/antitoxin HigA